MPIAHPEAMQRLGGAIGTGVLLAFFHSRVINLQIHTLIVMKIRDLRLGIFKFFKM